MKVGMKTLLKMNLILSHFPKWWCIYIIVGVSCQSLLIFHVAAILAHLVQYHIINNSSMHTTEISVSGEYPRKRKYSSPSHPPLLHTSRKLHVDALR